jgi:ElaB/YqjD/DUF883 family membrane-anchored ribosome-binding protein
MFGSARDNNTNGAKERMTNEGGPTIKNAEAKSEQFKDKAGTMASKAADYVQDAADTAGDKAQDMADIAGKSLANVGDIVAKNVQSNPVRAGLVALAVGLSLGILYGRRG